MPEPIIIVLVALAVLFAGIYVARRPRAALPSAPQEGGKNDALSEAPSLPTDAAPSLEPALEEAPPPDGGDHNDDHDAADPSATTPSETTSDSDAAAPTAPPAPPAPPALIAAAVPESVHEAASAPLFAPPKAKSNPAKGLGLPSLNLPSIPQLQRRDDTKAAAAPTPAAQFPTAPTPETAPSAESEPSSDAPLATPVPVELPQVKPKASRDPLEEQRRVRKGLSRTRKGFVARLAELVRGRPKVSDDLKDDIEEVLFTADIGAKTAHKLLTGVTEALDRDEVADPDAVWEVIHGAALEILRAPHETRAPTQLPVDDPPYVLLMIGVNGVGKTTTLGKLASLHAAEGRRVLLVAGDTFRAAAREQLDVWARRVGCDIHFGKEGADPSSVIFDGIAHARANGHDVVLCDTAGRLHTKKNLMDELGKIRRSAGKAMSQGQSTERWPHDTFLVLDATIGQNALSQATHFKETMEFTGLVLTKLDGTAKGGVVLGVCDELQVPIRYIGIGEGIEDLRVFSPETFADALFAREAD